ncbi:MAG: CPBP family intramembrane metalloprotease [Dehalococcoidia bacterium]|nr:CPBP family intramembrane metalloprotease [Dehalococcoidia bacterium]
MEEKAPHVDLVPWTVGDVALGIVVVIGLTLLIGFGLGMGTVLLIGPEASLELGIEGSTDLSKVFSAFLDFLEKEGLLQLWVVMALGGMVVSEGAMPLMAWLFSSVKYHRGWRALGFGSFKIKRTLILVAVVLIAGILVNLLYEWVLTSLGVEVSSTLPQELTRTGVSLAMMAILTVLVAPFAEETFFRGFIFAGIGNRYGYGWGVVVSALLFSLAHTLTYMQVWPLLPIFILGLLLAWLYMRTGSIWPCIFTHFAYNSIALLFMIL